MGRSEILNQLQSLGVVSMNVDLVKKNDPELYSALGELLLNLKRNSGEDFN